MAETAQASRARRATAQTHSSVTCPFCSILCDDLEISNTDGSLRIEANTCPRARAGFERPPSAATPLIGTRPASLDKAVAAAAKLIKSARHPLFGGLATDVAGMRAILALADRTGGVVDHMLGDGMYRNILAMQERGWMMTTLTELRNRADLVVFCGLDVGNDHPRFYERYIWNKESMFELDPRSRELVYLGKGLNTEAGVSPGGRQPQHLKNEPERLIEVIGALRSLLAGTPIQTRKVAGVAVRDLEKLIDRIKAARYAVFVWSPPRLAFPAADITVAGICDLVKELNQYTRCSGLALGGNEGIITAGAVCAWQSGYQLRVDFGRGYPEYDPTLNSTARLLESGDADLLVWVSNFNPDLRPPQTKVPTVVLAPPPAAADRSYDIYVPVAVPGLDHAGQMVRVDNVVSLPLHQVRQSALPSVATVMQSLLNHL
jgi:formylmethanofuran dehydrogenase subunit B